MTPLKIQFSNTFLAAGVACIIATAGCTRAKVLQTELVEGVVTLDGQPVPEATVIFSPVQAEAGAPATGMSDSTGKYNLTAVSGETGAQPQAGAGTLPGEYYVGVVKDTVPEMPQMNDAGYGVASELPTRPTDPAITHVVPERFNVPQTSGIKVTVKAGKNEIPIDLKSK
ncbi:MAG TPA: hypothetical protein VFW87_13690 [Pirellulales bacterium]|nr:hypothetical protein [Pirellulales bacterium]